MDEERSPSLPREFVAVYFDDETMEVQIGASSAMSQDPALWIRMLELAVKKLELGAYQSYLEQQASRGIIRP